MGKIVVALMTVVFLGAGQGMARAGWMDTLNSAAQKVQQAAQNQNSKGQKAEDPDRPLNLQYKGSCEGRRSATCMDYNEAIDQCMAPLRGYRMKMLSDRIEWKLKNEQLTDQERKVLKEDLEAAREAHKIGSDEPTIAGKAKSQRYLSDISEVDQIWINAEYGRMHNKITNKCMGADHMQTGRRTELIKDMGPSGDEAVAKYLKDNPPRKAAVNTCHQKMAALRYEIMADMMEKKAKTLKLSDKERAEWQADIAAVRDAAKSNDLKAMPKVSDAANPYRPLTRLSTPEDMMAYNNEYTRQTQLAMENCNRSR